MTEETDIRTRKLRDTRMRIDTLMNELRIQAKSKRDYVHKTDALVVEPSENNKILMEVPEEGLLPLTPTAHGNLAQKLEIPMKFYNRLLRRNHNDLLALTLSTLLIDYSERHLNGHARRSNKFLIRTLADRDGQQYIRYIGSEFYKRIDNDSLVKMVMVKCKELGDDIYIDRCDLTPFSNNLYLVALKGQLRATLPKRGDIVGGMLLKNSETGEHSTNIESFLKVITCDNGASRNLSLKKVHRGRRIDMQGILSQRTLELEDAELYSFLQDFIEATFEQERFDQWVEAIQNGLEYEVENPKLGFENIVAKYRLPESVENDLITHFTKGQGSTQFDFAQSITRTAQDVPTANQQIDLEAIGGEIITMDQTDFDKLISGRPSRFGKRVVEAEIIV